METAGKRPTKMVIVRTIRIKQETNEHLRTTRIVAKEGKNTASGLVCNFKFYVTETTLAPEEKG